MASIKPDYSIFSPEDITKMEEITGVPARAMLVQAGLLPAPPAGALVLDNACGGGVVAAQLFGAIGPGTTTSDLHVVCGDLEKYMVKSAAERIEKHGWNAEAKVVDAQAMPFPDNHFTHTVMNFGIQVIPDNAFKLVVKESFRVLRSGGTIGFTTWIAPGWLDTFKHGVPTFVEPPLFKSGPTATEESITGLLTGAGFTRVNVQPIIFEHTDAMVRFLRYMGEMFKTLLAGETKKEYEEYMKERYGEGDFTLTWKACVVTAVKP
ncbi:S-adenosyl-L-methionine-dependent methyltransferase [Mycena pura]|uniref:S-adenosyl-L-methionine-dependent methyltransferase n=1 Tax=Mycena pura TaxID=153505 RepID=A0AAD6USP0_9AGAR|nr:S-adenosyl-L-methionine-dependent methyltransferase [Mycena pura]